MDLHGTERSYKEDFYADCIYCGKRNALVRCLSICLSVGPIVG